MTERELDHWQMGEEVFTFKPQNTPRFEHTKGFYFLSGREKIIFKRMKRGRASQQKMTLALKSAELIAKLPSILFVGITGSLAMHNARVSDDIDLLVISRKNSLWTSRFLAHALLKFKGIEVRRFGYKAEKNKICLNMWLDESRLAVAPSLFTAHELAQIIPLVNKNKTYEKLMAKNVWYKKYWPHVQVAKAKSSKNRNFLPLAIFEPIAYYGQKAYMRHKITHETVGWRRALFHPVDWERKVFAELARRGVVLK